MKERKREREKRLEERRRYKILRVHFSFVPTSLCPTSENEG
jgi:hypothetical protein